MLMINRGYFNAVKRAAEQPAFKTVISITDEQAEKQRHLEMAVRFLVHTKVPYDGRLDVEEYIDEGIVTLAQAGDHAGAESLINRTFHLLNEAAGTQRTPTIPRWFLCGKGGFSWPGGHRRWDS